ncbi:MAG: hypothetical protein HUU38_16360 [Anaerolineales bacterium]|nr:hypothetical protein [Anaerolineales bacterium]
MAVLIEDVVPGALNEREMCEAAAFAYHVLTHSQSTRTDMLTGYFQVLIEEVAERMVIQWLREHGKFVEPCGDKGATQPDLSHEIWVTDVRGLKVRAAIHTFLSTNKSEIPDILENHSLSVDAAQICGINFSVVYWYQLREKPRVKLPAIQHAAIIGWASDKNFREKTPAGHTSKFLAIRFSELRPANELLQYLV